MAKTFRMLLGLVLLLTTGAASAQQAQDPGSAIKVGLVLPLTGGIPSFGAEAKGGIDLAIREWNSQGGVLGRQILAVYGDGQCMADAGVVAATKLINEDQVHYILGEVCSSATMAIAELANAAGVVEITPTSTNTAVTVDSSGQTRAFIFRSCFIDSYQGILGAKFASGTLGAARAFLLRNPGNQYDAGLCDSFIRQFQALGGSIVGDESYGSQDTDFSALLLHVKDAAPDLVFLPDYYNIVNLVTRQAKKLGLAVPFLGGDGWDSSDLDKRSADGSYFTNHLSLDDPRPEVQAFITAYEKTIGTPPSIISALAYDAAEMLFQAIAHAGVDDAAVVRNELESLSFHGVTGSLTVDEHHNPVKTGVIMAVRNGKVEFLTTIDP
jgi:branched-chain amino acid transport system substrate-binding protein